MDLKSIWEKWCEIGDTVEDDLKHFKEISTERSLLYFFIVMTALLSMLLLLSMQQTQSVIAKLEPTSLENAKALCGFDGNFTWLLEHRDWAKIIDRSGGWNISNFTTTT